MSLQNDLEPKQLGLLISGLIKATVEQDANVDELTKQIFAQSQLPQQDVSSLVGGLQRLLKQAAEEHWSQSDLQKQLAETDLPAAQSEVFQQVWAKRRNEVHDVMVSKSNWSKGISNVSWRIDVQSASRYPAAAAADGATAIMQLNLKSAAGVPNSEVVLFEMDRATVASTLAQLTAIQDLISART